MNTVNTLRASAFCALVIAASAPSDAQAYDAVDFVEMAATALSETGSTALNNVNAQYGSLSNDMLEIILSEYAYLLPKTPSGGVDFTHEDIVVRIIEVANGEARMWSNYLEKADSIISAANQVNALLDAGAPVSSAAGLFKSVKRFSAAAKTIGTEIARGNSAIMETLLTLLHGGDALFDVASLGDDVVKIVEDIVAETDEAKRSRMINGLIGESGLSTVAEKGRMAAHGGGELARKLILQDAILDYVKDQAPSHDAMRSIKVYTTTYDTGMFGFIGGGYSEAIARYGDVSVDEDKIATAIEDKEWNERLDKALERQREEERRAAELKKSREALRKEEIRRKVEENKAKTGATPSYRGSIAMMEPGWSSTMSLRADAEPMVSGDYAPPRQAETTVLNIVDGTIRVSAPSTRLDLTHFAGNLSYMSWGRWSGQQPMTAGTVTNTFTSGVFVLGRATTVTEINRLSGTASYSGRIEGSYQDSLSAGPMSGTMSLTADFGARSVSGMFNFQRVDGSPLGRARFAGAEMDGGYFHGPLSPTRTGITGGGDARGRFFGPTAQEVGGSIHYEERDARMNGVFFGTRGTGR